MPAFSPKIMIFPKMKVQLFTVKDFFLQWIIEMYTYFHGIFYAYQFFHISSYFIFNGLSQESVKTFFPRIASLKSSTLFCYS